MHFLEADYQTMKLGKAPPRADTRTLQLKDYILPTLAPPPAGVDYSKKVSAWGAMGNRDYGDCVVAAAGHMVQEWTSNSGVESIVPDSEILYAYRHFVGSKNDAGVNMLDFLLYWRALGLGSHKAAAIRATEFESAMQVRQSVYLIWQIASSEWRYRISRCQQAKTFWLYRGWCQLPELLGMPLLIRKWALHSRRRVRSIGSVGGHLGQH